MSILEKPYYKILESFAETETRIVWELRTGERGDGVLVFSGYKVSVWDDRHTEMEGHDGCTSM